LFKTNIIIGVQAGGGINMLEDIYNTTIHKTNYKDMSDDELIKLINNGDKQAEEILIERYKKLVFSKSKLYYIVSGDRNDVIQEGMIGLYKAIRDYEINKQSSFRSFASICIMRQMITAIKAANRQKHQLLNSSISLNKPIYNEESDRTLLDVLNKNELNPEYLYISQEKYEFLKTKIREILTDLEFNVIKEYSKDKSYKEIAGALNTHTKSVDNALQRARNKLQEFLDENNI